MEKTQETVQRILLEPYKYLLQLPGNCLVMVHRSLIGSCDGVVVIQMLAYGKDFLFNKGCIQGKLQIEHFSFMFLKGLFWGCLAGSVA